MSPITPTVDFQQPSHNSSPSFKSQTQDRPQIDRIEKNLDVIGNLMTQHLSRRDFGSVAQMSALLTRIQQLRKRAEELDGELCDVESSIKGLNVNHPLHKEEELVTGVAEEIEDQGYSGRSGPQTMRIEIDWKANGKNLDREIILLPNAGDGIVRFLSRLVEEFGQDTLQKLPRIPINRGPLLSKTPSKDFLNRAQGKPYTHKRLPGTDYFVLTHSSTSQKIDDVRRISEKIGLAAQSIQVRQMSRSECYEEMYK